MTSDGLEGSRPQAHGSASQRHAPAHGHNAGAAARTRVPRERLAHPRVHNHLEVRECDIIGDVHGCCDELEGLLVKLGHGDLLDPSHPAAPPGAKPRIVFVGDLVDRGDRVLDTVRLVMRLHRHGHALAVVGNHDDRLLRWMSGRRVLIRHGIEETIAELEALPEDDRESFKAETFEFFSGLPWALRLDDGHLLVAHAAWHAELFEDPATDRLRSYTLFGPTTGRVSPEGYPERIDWAPHYTGPELVVFGHQVYDAPYVHEHAIGIDTGCVFGGALTALRYPSMEITSVRSTYARKR